MKLSELKQNQSAVILKVNGKGAFKKRITEMGFQKGRKVTIVKGAPLKDPILYSIMGYEISLRKREAELIEVSTQTSDFKDTIGDIYTGTSDGADYHIIDSGIKTITIALVGNPNCGKTTLFNRLSNSHEKVGNYSGVTVDVHTSSYKSGKYTIKLTDLPGTYSLTAYSPEELFVRDYIVNEKPDIVLNVIDSSNLERNLYLTTQLIDMDVRTLIALNMYDEVQEAGISLEYEKLGKMLGIPMIPTVSSKGKGVYELIDCAIRIFEGKDETIRNVNVNYGSHIENSIGLIVEYLNKYNCKLKEGLPNRFVAIKLLEKDKAIMRSVSELEKRVDILNIATQEIKRLENELQSDSETILTDAKYGFIAGALKNHLKLPKEAQNVKSRTIDNILTHKIWGFPIFLFFMWMMFQITFTVGQYPMDWIDQSVLFISNLIHLNFPDGMLKDLITDGIIGGVGGVIVFLPNIVLLFFFISLMEDTGYIARTAFIMDKLMHKIGLHGKSFIPLLMGFGCNVPAIMATRTLESRNNRLLTMLIAPFMSCSARLPVYILLIGAFFPEHPALILFSIYIIGILLAVLVSILFKYIFFNSEEVPFVMELPPYRIPTAKSLVVHMWVRASQYLKKMGGMILIASIIIWAMGYFPREVEYTKDYDSLIKSQEVIVSTSTVNTAEKTDAQTLLNQIKIEQEAERFQNSYIGKLGVFIEPLIHPLGFDWKMGVSLITGMAAKEIVVSTMGVLYQATLEADEKSEVLVDKLKNHRYQIGPRKGEKVFNKLNAYGFMLFILIYFPCVAVIAAIHKESGGWKWAVFTMVYTTALAWIVSFAFYQISLLFA